MIPLLLHNRIYGEFWFAAGFLLLSIAAVEGLKCRQNDEKTQQDFNDVVRACMSSIHGSSNRNDNSYNSSSAISGRNDNNRYNEDHRNTGNNNMRKNVNRGSSQHYNNNNRNTYNNRGGVEESDDSSEETGYQNQRNRNSGGSIYDRNNGFNKNTFDQNGGRRPNRTGTFSSSTSGTSRHPSIPSPLEDIEPCIVHCVFRQMRMLDGDSKPDKGSVITVMTQKINNPELKEFIQDSIMDCFEIVESALNVDDKCEFSKQFALCLEEKGQQNCEDWEEDNKRNGSFNQHNNRTGNNRQDNTNNRNTMRPTNSNHGNNGNPNSNQYRG